MIVHVLKVMIALLTIILHCVFRYSPNKRWHIDTMMKVLTTVSAKPCLSKHPLYIIWKMHEGKLNIYSQECSFRDFSDR